MGVTAGPQSHSPLGQAQGRPILAPNGNPFLRRCTKASGSMGSTCRTESAQLQEDPCPLVGQVNEVDRLQRRLSLDASLPAPAR